MQLAQHNLYIKRALERAGVATPVKEFGRRSNNVAAWIGSLFHLLRDEGFDEGDEQKRTLILEQLCGIASVRLDAINDAEPLLARFNRGTPMAVIADVLDQAQRKNRAKDVAEYLVGAKLQLRFGEDAATPKNVNTPNRDGPADFRVGNAAIEVTVSPPAR